MSAHTFVQECRGSLRKKLHHEQQIYSITEYAEASSDVAIMDAHCQNVIRRRGSPSCGRPGVPLYTVGGSPYGVNVPAREYYLKRFLRVLYAGLIAGKRLRSIAKLFNNGKNGSVRKKHVDYVCDAERYSYEVFGAPSFHAIHDPHYLELMAEELR